MTQQYGQDSINLVGSSPVVLQTPDATPVSVELQTLTANGQTFAALILGAGSNPADVSTDNYTSFAFTIFARDAGVVTLGTPTVAVIGLGVAPALAFTIDGDRCLLTITGPAFPYDHQFIIMPMPPT